MCTTLIVTRGATADGSMTVTHSDDDELGDQRVIRVPAADHAPGSQREVFKEDYPFPCLVSNDRGPHYTPEGTDRKHRKDPWPLTVPIGYVPQVPHTYAYFDGNYGIMNEHNLMMGECTNAANYQPECVTAEEAGKTGKHKRLFYSSELSRIALERCTRAREAIQLMGSLIEDYGCYSTGETLLVADPEEAWVFEMCALPNETHHSAWVAQRVPDGEVFVAANEFRIRQVHLEHQDDQLHSKTLFEDLEAVGYWKPQDGPLDWLRAVSPGEYNHPYYSLRRVWRVLDRVNPDLGLSPWVEDGYTTAYPFSVKPKHKLRLEEIFGLYRDHYEGTQFDLTKDVAAGPYGDPTRFVGPYDGNQNDITKGVHASGAWERPISVFYQGYTYVLQHRPDSVPEAARGAMWFAPDVCSTSVFAPFYAKVFDLPERYQIGDPREYDRLSAWWIFDFVSNWARLNFQRMTQVDILPRQLQLEREGQEFVARTDAAVRGTPARAVEIMTEASIGFAGRVLDSWRDLSDELIAKYSDGYINPSAEERQPAIAIGYPSTWLAKTSYAGGPLTYEMKMKP